MTIGNKIKGLREEKGILQRELAALLEISEAYLSKVENNQKPLKRKDLIKISKIFKSDLSELEKVWLASKLYESVKDEAHGLDALKLAEEQMKYDKKENE